jgi:hypothetical protein
MARVVIDIFCEVVFHLIIRAEENRTGGDAMRRENWWIVLGLCLIPMVATAKAPPSKKAKNGGLDRAPFGRSLQVVALDKRLDTKSKVKGVFSKSSRTVTLDCEIQNLGAREIRAMRGASSSHLFRGPHRGPLGRGGDQHPPGSKVNSSWKLKRERFASDAAFKKFVDTPLDKMRMTWLPSVAVTADGTQLLP